MCKLQDLFGERLSANQTETLYKVSGGDFAATMDCLLKWPTLQPMMKLLNERFLLCPTMKVRIDPSEAWRLFTNLIERR